MYLILRKVSILFYFASFNHRTKGIMTEKINVIGIGQF